MLLLLKDNRDTEQISNYQISPNMPSGFIFTAAATSLGDRANILDIDVTKFRDCGLNASETGCLLSTFASRTDILIPSLGMCNRAMFDILSRYNHYQRPKICTLLAMGRWCGTVASADISIKRICLEGDYLGYACKYDGDGKNVTSSIYCITLFHLLQRSKG